MVVDEASLVPLMLGSNSYDGTNHFGWPWRDCWDMLGHWVYLFFCLFFWEKNMCDLGVASWKKPYTCSNINDQENRQASPGGQTCALPQLSALLGAAGTGRPGQWMWGGFALPQSDSDWNGKDGHVLRSWNMHIFRKDQGAARRMPEMAAGEDGGWGSESTKRLLFVC